jgi:hypothetical protein
LLVDYNPSFTLLEISNGINNMRNGDSAIVSFASSSNSHSIDDH